MTLDGVGLSKWSASAPALTRRGLEPLSRSALGAHIKALIDTSGQTPGSRWLRHVAASAASWSDDNLPVLLPHGCLRRAWDGLILLSVTYTATVVPVEAAFELVDASSNTWVVINIAIDILFLQLSGF